MLDMPWQKAPPPENEEARLQELRAYQILDTVTENAFDRLTKMAAVRFGVPIALVSLVDQDRQWFKSHYGLDAKETPRDVAFCAHAILQNDVMVVTDASTDPRFHSNPLVRGQPDIRFYAGAPLKTKNGHNMGTLCVIDRVPHPDFSEIQKQELAELASIAIDEMELRLSVHRAQQNIETMEATHRALEEAQKKAEQSTHEKSQFVATISHELRTPMNGILGMAYLLNDTPLDATQREYIDTINHSAQNLLLLINDVLDLSKIEAGELLLEKSPFDIKHSFLQTIKLLTPLAQKKGTTLLHCIHTHIPETVIGDQGRFTQIVTNLVGNAVKFTEGGKVETGLLYNEEDHTIYCEVTDTGIGIPPSKHDSIFERFTQGDPSITQKYGGTGLGLAITKHLVMMLGGEIGFESQEKVGSRFWFKLPIMLPDGIVFQDLDKVLSNTATGRTDANRACVLIAEDHPVNQMFLMALLRKFGFALIDIAENGKEATNKIQRNKNENAPRYDAIFMDCKMPEQDGYETTKIIRSLERSEHPPSHTPIIAMTANALAGDRETCFDAGMDAYISKPLQPDRLKDVLKRWFVFAADTDISSPPCAHPANNNPPLDRARLQLVAETTQDEAAILTLFFRSAHQIIDTMENARRDDEFPRWKEAVHGLKGAASNLGMRDMETLCGQAEKAIDLSYPQRSALLQRVKDELERIKNYVSQQLQTTKA